MTTSALDINPQVLRDHGLTRGEYDRIKSLLGGREPTLTELGIFSVMWSEHCSYKSSRVHLKRLPTQLTVHRNAADGPRQNSAVGQKRKIKAVGSLSGPPPFFVRKIPQDAAQKCRHSHPIRPKSVPSGAAYP